jgi:hypothetical protein
LCIESKIKKIYITELKTKVKRWFFVVEVNEKDRRCRGVERGKKSG